MNKNVAQLAPTAMTTSLVEKSELVANKKSGGELMPRSSDETKHDNYIKAAVALSGVIAAIAGVASAPIAVGVAVGKFNEVGKFKNKFNCR